MSERLESESAILAIVDWQERLFLGMNPGFRDESLRRVCNLKWLADCLNMPVVTSEQYPRGLGFTMPDIGAAHAIAKTAFSAMAQPEFADAVKETERMTVILVGMETHICVAQTCRDLLAQGYAVWIVADACLSRKRLDWELGLERMRADGARIVTAEAALFELIGGAESSWFRELSRRIR